MLLIKIKEEMNACGAINSMMSGSGPTVFAFFDDMLKAQKCFEKMKKKLFAILLCGVMALGLAGCSNPVSDSKKE